MQNILESPIITPIPKRLTLSFRESYSTEEFRRKSTESYSEPTKEIDSPNQTDNWHDAYREFTEIMSRISFSSENDEEEDLMNGLVEHVEIQYPQPTADKSWKMKIAKSEDIKKDEISIPNGQLLTTLDLLPLAPSPIRRAGNPVPSNPSFSFCTPVSAP
ncbi:uncharacterized protein VTP21DRAFT_497 [Calcarisporiella thermophila]|uniref:uncharacterized protein n=1 Tax=Calcarisporiella thermophila TaxID=911321 RepID=UPI0037444EC0